MADSDMAKPVPNENRSDETQPLLTTATPEPVDDEEIQAVAEKPNKWARALYWLSGLAGIVLLVFFIKAFIDAGEFEVRMLINSECEFNVGSLTWVKPSSLLLVVG